VPEPPARWVADAHVRWRRQGQGGILLNTDTGEVYRLNEVAMRMWSLLMEGSAADDAIGEIVQETAADAERIKADWDGFVASMAAAGVLRPLGPDQGEAEDGKTS